MKIKNHHIFLQTAGKKLQLYSSSTSKNKFSKTIKYITRKYKKNPKTTRLLKTNLKQINKIQNSYLEVLG